MMLRYTFDNEAAAQRIENAIKKVLAQVIVQATFMKRA
jgi:3-isopropylmalate dehydrogenase